MKQENFKCECGNVAKVVKRSIKNKNFAYRLCVNCNKKYLTQTTDNEIKIIRYWEPRKYQKINYNL